MDNIVTNIIDQPDIIQSNIIESVSGREVELQNNGTFVQWRYVGDANWVNLISISGLSGQDGAEVELRNNGTFVQWRYVGDANWTNLISISSLQGPAGPPGPQNLFIQKTEPSSPNPFLWIELNNDNSVKTFWINS